MKLNKEREINSKIVSKAEEDFIRNKGLDNYFKETKKFLDKNKFDFIENSYIDFIKDLKCYPYAIGKKNNLETLSVIKTLESNRNNINIFDIENDEKDYPIKFPIIPFNKFYVSSLIYKIIENDLYVINGFFVLEYKDRLLIFYEWHRRPSDGWGINSFLARRESFSKKFIDTTKDETINSELQNFAIQKFWHLLRKLLFKLEKKEYNTYKKYSHGRTTKKEIVFSSKISSHKRHFWKDSGRFKIPYLSSEEMKSQGYLIDEMVYKNGELRENVPYSIIGNYEKNLAGKKQDIKKHSLIEKRILRQEQKVFNILKEIFPEEFIKRHDRKVLKGLELDFLIRDKRLGIEYDGEQHFDKELCEKVFKSDFESLQKRDRTKDKLCKKKNMTLIRIKYDEPLTKTHIKNKLKRVGVLK